MSDKAYIIGVAIMLTLLGNYIMYVIYQYGPHH